MDFFKQLVQAGGGNVDITMRIMQKGDTITMSIMPGSHKSTNKPFNISGTAEDIDQEFFSTVFAGVQQIKGLNSNLDAVLKEAEKKTADAKKGSDKKKVKKDDKKAEKKKPAEKAKDKKKSEAPVAVEANMFEQEVETPTEETPAE